MKTESLVRFIHKREAVRIAKDAGKPKPWTDDPILQTYRFCNVRREDDKVTRWIKDHWRIPYWDHPNLFIAMILSRMINWPPCLSEIGFPERWNEATYLNRLKKRKMKGDQLWGGAYMVTAGGRPIPKEEAVCDIISQFHESPYRPKMGDSLQESHDKILDLGISGIGTFLTGQFIADLKYTHYLEDAWDWWEFCTPGPGSTNGLNIVMEMPEGTQWKQDDFMKGVNKIREKIPFKICAQDLQNCLCEFSKYVRGYSKSKYPGAR